MDDQEQLDFTKPQSDQGSKTQEAAVSSEEEAEEEDDSSSSLLQGRVAIVRGPNG